MNFSKLLFGLLILGIAFCGFSCNDDDDKSPTGASTTTGTVKATVSGTYSVSFNANQQGSGVSDGDIFSIIGIYNSGSNVYQITISIYAPINTGTYDILGLLDMNLFNGNALGVFSVGTGGNAISHTSYSGTVNVTEAGSRLKGTFSFEARQNLPGSPEVSVTSGSFDVPVTTITP